MYSISFIGAGNVAFRLSLALHLSGYRIECICNRNLEKADQIVRALKRHKGNAFITDDYKQLPDSDIIIIAVSDQAIAQIASHIHKSGSLVVHTSGATSLDVLKYHTQKESVERENYGVFYPLMTLSKNKNLDTSLVPFLLEASNKESEKKLINLVRSLKAEYKICDSRKRLQMHTAAVFSTNFINYMLTLAYDISNPDFTFLLPAAVETVRKAFLHTPQVSQTGPALRNDLGTMQKHIELLEREGNQEYTEVYKMLSQNIMERYSKEKKER